MGPLWGRYGVLKGSLWGRYGVAVGSLWGRYGIAMGFLRGRYGAIMGLLWGRYGVAVGQLTWMAMGSSSPAGLTHSRHSGAATYCCSPPMRPTGRPSRIP